jgi:hypothetical protein
VAVDVGRSGVLCAGITAILRKELPEFCRSAVQGKPQTISTDIDLATNLAGASLFGECETAVADLDRAYNAPHRVPEGN